MQALPTIVRNDKGFSVKGAVSFDRVVALRELGEQWISAASQQNCTIDLSEMHNDDASAFSLLLCWMRKARQKGIKIQFISAAPALARMQHLFGLEKVWINY